MQVQVVRLRRKGLRLRPAECDPPARGELRVRVEASNNTMQTPRRVAILFRMEGVDPREMQLLVPLFDPRLIRLDRDLLVLAGIELSADSDNEHRVHEFVQIWRCKLLGSVSAMDRMLQEWW